MKSDPTLRIFSFDLVISQSALSGAHRKSIRMGALSLPVPLARLSFPFFPLILLYRSSLSRR